jgi:integrase
MTEVTAIKDKGKIMDIRKILRGDLRNGPRNELLFIMGINLGLRISDLLSLRIKDVWEKDRPKANLALKEQKTRKNRSCPINSLVQDLLKTYINGRKSPMPDDFLFPSQKGNGPLGRHWAFKILQAAGKAVGLPNIGTHTLRKTFGYHAFKATNGNISLIQKIFNHSHPEVTLRYIGITREDMNQVYLNLKLG